MSLKDDKQQNTQKQLDFPAAPTGESREAGREETESSMASNGPESPARTDRLMEEICEPENLKEALRQVKANKGSAGIDRMTVGQLADSVEAALASYSGTAVEWNLRAEAGPSGGNIEARRRSAQTWHSDSVGSIYPAGGDAGSTKAVGPDVFC